MGRRRDSWVRVMARQVPHIRTDAGPRQKIRVARDSTREDLNQPWAEMPRGSSRPEPAYARPGGQKQMRHSMRQLG